MVNGREKYRHDKITRVELNCWRCATRRSSSGRQIKPNPEKYKFEDAIRSVMMGNVDCRFCLDRTANGANANECGRLRNYKVGTMKLFAASPRR
jgi:hypothetical protein